VAIKAGEDQALIEELKKSIKNLLNEISAGIMSETDEAMDNDNMDYFANMKGVDIHVGTNDLARYVMAKAIGDKKKV
jgi:phosphoenolpyruvate-protein kinase (PTS system EI component)